MEKLFLVIIFLSIIYYILKENNRVIFLFILSICFYFLVSKNMAIIVLCEILINYYLIKKLQIVSAQEKSKKILLFCGIVLDIFVLFVFRDWVNIWIPIGLSYISFKMISFLIEVYRGERYQETLVTYTLYILFFPQIFAGPIERPGVLLNQFQNGIKTEKNLILEGIDKIIFGLFQKVVIANRLEEYVNYAFANPEGNSGLILWIGAIFYSIYIYCDFAGYSNLSIGISNLLGIKINANFNLPYFSHNLNEFWRKWHISLSSWLRDYIYIPLGGNKVSKKRKHINVLMTFIVSGVWHGKGLNYLLWGILHGVLCMLPCKKDLNKGKCKDLFILGMNFLIITFLWIFFKSSNIQLACQYIIGMFTRFSISYQTIIEAILPFTFDNASIAYFLVAVFMILLLFIKEYLEYLKGRQLEINYRWQTVWLVCIILLGTWEKSGFVYMNF